MTDPDSQTPDHQALSTTQPIADVLLASPPSTTSDDDLTAALSAPPPSARSRRLTVILAAALLLVLGFVGGVWAQQQWGGDQLAAGPGGGPGGAGQARGAQQRGLPSSFPDVTGQPGTAGQGQGDGTASDTTTGEVTLIDGDVIYLTTASGEQVRVEVEDSTSISTNEDADLSDVEEGDTVTVTGTTGDSGLAATSVEVDR